LKADFVYDADRDVYVCPAGDTLTYRYTTEERGIPIRRYWINGCKTCPLRTNCTTGNERRISRWEREDLVDDMDSRPGRDPDYMTLRPHHPLPSVRSIRGLEIRGKCGLRHHRYHNLTNARLNVTTPQNGIMRPGKNDRTSERPIRPFREIGRKHDPFHGLPSCPWHEGK
jgi:hypothetical protein